MDNHPSEQLAVILYRVNRTLHYLMTLHFKSYNITPEQWNVLKHLQEKDGISQRDLSYIADKDKTTITRIVDSLEQRGAVRRQLNPSDHRSFLIKLTEKGRTLIHDLQPIPDLVNRTVTQHLTYEEIVLLKQILLKLQEQVSLEIKQFPLEQRI